jgi:hypothetical protein
MKAGPKARVDFCVKMAPVSPNPRLGCEGYFAACDKVHDEAMTISCGSVGTRRACDTECTAAQHAACEEYQHERGELRMALDDRNRAGLKPQGTLDSIEPRCNFVSARARKSQADRVDFH